MLLAPDQELNIIFFFGATDLSGMRIILARSFCIWVLQTVHYETARVSKKMNRARGCIEAFDKLSLEQKETWSNEICLVVDKEFFPNPSPSK